MLISGIDRLSLDPTSRSTLREFIASWDSHGGLVVFVGAGFSAYQATRRAGVPVTSKFGTWWDLSEAFGNALSDNDAEAKKRLPVDPLRLAELHEAEFGRSAMLQVISRHVPARDFEPGPAHLRLRDLPLTAVVTGNYDDLLERTFDDYRPYRCIVADDDVTASAKPGALPIVKMHGDLRRPDTIIISEEDYRIYDRNRPGIALKVRQLLMEHPTLFLGFSRDDPHFVRIDGWIRDTVGGLKIRAVSVAHEKLRQADERMWSRRGVSVVQGPNDRDGMADLLAAMGEEWRKQRSHVVDPPRFCDRVQRLAGQVRASVRGASPDVYVAARLLGEIVDRAATDPDGGAEARREARWVAYGWHSVLRGDPDPEHPHVPPPVLMRLKDIYNSLLPDQQVRLLMLALEAGELTFRFAPDDLLDVVSELSQRSLANDERARVHLLHARVQRDRGDSAAAIASVQKGRDVVASSPGGAGIRSVQADLTLELREVAFSSGNAQRLEEELQLPPDDDALTACRRGADSLLLGNPQAAGAWYQRAIERARNDDERYVALWGRRAAANAGWSEPPEREAAFWEEVRRMQRENRPAINALEEHRDEAARRALNGDDSMAVVGPLRRYLDGLRRVGWPHTSMHNVSFHAESTARQAARHLLRDQTNEGRAVDRAKEALTLLNMYGLADDVGKLFETRHVEALARSHADVSWFRSFAAERPTLRRPLDARLTTAIVGVPLLDDAAIEQLVGDVAVRTEEWLEGEAQDDLLPSWWKHLARSSEHLPGPAVKRIVPLAIRCARDRRAAMRLEPGEIDTGLWLWRRLNFIEPGVGQSLAELAVCVFREPSIVDDGWWLRAVCDLVRGGLENGLLSDPDKARVVEALDAALESLVGARAHKCVDLAWVLAEGIKGGQGSASLDRLASQAVALVQRELNSSRLSSTLGLLTELLPSIDQAVKLKLLGLLLDQAQALQAEEARLMDRGGPIVRALGALVYDDPARRADVAPVVRQLVERDPVRYGDWVDLGAVFADDDEAAVSLARLLLLTPASPRRWRLGVVMKWLAERPGVPGRGELVDGVIGLMASDEPGTRRAAIDMLRHEWANVVIDDAARRSRLMNVLSRLAVADASWMVKASALQALARLAQGDEEAASVRALLEDAQRADIALLRRVAAVALTELVGRP